MIYQISRTILMVIGTIISTKQGLSMMNPKQSLTDVFAEYGFTKPQLKLLGSITLLGAVLTLSPFTFLMGTILIGAELLIGSFWRFRHKNPKVVAIELSFIMLNLLMIYLQYPVKDLKHR